MVFNACVDLLHALPSVALRGASKADVLKLVRKHQAQGEAIQGMMG